LPALQPYLNTFPLPNGADNPAAGIAQFNASYSNPATLDAYSLRLDHRLNNRLNVFGRYNYSPSETVERGGVGSLTFLVALGVFLLLAVRKPSEYRLVIAFAAFHGLAHSATMLVQSIETSMHGVPRGYDDVILFGVME
jgi:hypothetical protein